MFCEGAVDEIAPGGGECDDASATVGLADAAHHVARAFEAVEALGHASGRDHGGGREFAGGALTRFSGATQSGEDVEVAFGESVPAVQGGQFLGEGCAEPVQATEDAQGCDVQFGTLSAPLRLYARDLVKLFRHPYTVPFREAKLSSVEAKWLVVVGAAPVTWGATYWVTGQALPVGEPLWGGVLRALPAGLVLLALRPRLLPRGWWWRAAAVGTLVNGAFFSLVYASAQLLPSSIAATVAGVGPLVVLASAWLLQGQRPRRPAVVAALTGLVGVALLVSAAPAGLDPAGVAVALAGVLVFSTGTVLSQRWARQAAERGEAAPAPLVAVAWQLVLSGALLAPVAVVAEGAPPRLDGAALVALAFVSLVATALAFVCWFTGLAHLPASSVGLVGLLNPLTGALLGTAVAGEQLAPLQLVGLALVLGGIAMGRARPRASSESVGCRAVR